MVGEVLRLHRKASKRKASKDCCPEFLRETDYSSKPKISEERFPLGRLGLEKAIPRIKKLVCLNALLRSSESEAERHILIVVGMQIALLTFTFSRIPLFTVDDHCAFNEHCSYTIVWSCNVHRTVCAVWRALGLHHFVLEPHIPNDLIRTVIIRIDRCGLIGLFGTLLCIQSLRLCDACAILSTRCLNWIWITICKPIFWCFSIEQIFSKKIALC